MREFDIASWDRVKRMDVEPDYSVWKTYAYEQGMHPAILTYLDLKKDAFYSVKIQWMESICDSKRLGRFKSDHVPE